MRLKKARPDIRRNTRLGRAAALRRLCLAVVMAPIAGAAVAGVLRPDHVPTVEGDSNENAGYSAFGRLYAIGYIRGLHQAVYAD